MRKERTATQNLNVALAGAEAAAGLARENSANSDIVLECMIEAEKYLKSAREAMLVIQAAASRI